jgi:hypothetical protein
MLVLRKACSVFMALASTALAAPAGADVISDWNARADAIAAERRVTALPHAHNMALLQVAVFEAVNAVERRCVPHKLKLPSDKTASTEAAAAAAAHAVLLALLPEEQAKLDAGLASSLARVADGQPKMKGIELGRRAAAELPALRANDSAKAPDTYRPQSAPGVYVPTVIPAGVTFGSVRPWSMESGAQFRPPAPPPLSSETWTRDLNEIREIGGLNSTQRTAEQTDIGRFWLITGPQSWNPVVRELVRLKPLDLVESARLFALVAMATDDAYIAVFDAKYHYNLWRPVTAIRNADITGNPATPRDPAWLPLGETPMHPEYPCAHCITSAAAAVVLKSVFGNAIPALSIMSPTAPGVTRAWTRIDDYADEIAAARIYAGFHYRFSTKIGAEMGRKIGELTVKTQLRASEAASVPEPR